MQSKSVVPASGQRQGAPASNAPLVYRPSSLTPLPPKISAPPVYRLALSSLQSKMAAPKLYRPAPQGASLGTPAGAPPRSSGTPVTVAPPPVFRPAQALVAQLHTAPAPRRAPGFILSGAPAVYRPGSSATPSSATRQASSVLQPKPGPQTPSLAPPPPPSLLTRAVVQRMKYVRRNGRIFEVPDEYKKKDKERWATREQFVSNPSGMSSEKKDLLAQEEAARLEAARVLEAQRVEAARVAEERRQALRARKARLAKYPRRISRRDRNFANQQNSRGQGKAHIVGGGLAAAGITEIPPTEQLIQGSPNKGTSNLISFTGPNPNPGTVYGPADTAQEVHVKMRKLARAQLREKADAQHLELLTSGELMALAREEEDWKQLTSYVRKDDEHQVRVRPGHGVGRPVIAARFLVGPRGEELHDSDSESEDEG